MGDWNFTALAKSFFDSYETRFGRKEKNAFLEKCRQEFLEMGYSDDEIIIQKSALGQNLMVGPKDAGILVTAHYDTPGRTGFLLAASPLVGQALANLLFAVVLFGLVFFVQFFVVYFGLTSGAQSIDSIVNIAQMVLLCLLILMLLPMVIKNRHNRNDNTSGVLGVMKIASLAAKSPEVRQKCAFVLFDNEEWGLLGSSAFASWRKKMNPALSDCKVINLDCIGAGEYLVAASPKNNEIRSRLTAFFRSEGISIAEKNSSMIYMSDHAHFPNGVMLSYAKKARSGHFFLPNVHTGKDLECDLDKIAALGDHVFTCLRQL